MDKGKHYSIFSDKCIDIRSNWFSILKNPRDLDGL